MQKWNELVLINPPRRAQVMEIALAFMEGRTLTVRQSGYIELMKQVYYYSKDNTLRQHRGRKVQVRYNPVDGFWWHSIDGSVSRFLPHSLFLFDENNKFLCEAKHVTPVPGIGATQEQMHRTMALQADVLRSAKGTLNMLNQTEKKLPPVTDIITVPTEEAGGG